MKKEKNYAFVDGQNLHMGTTKVKKSWQINFKRFRKFLRDKYQIEIAYFFLGYKDEENEDLYANIEEAGFELIFREHNAEMVGEKKGNVDADIVFAVMSKLCGRERFNKIFLVSGDGDYKKMVDFLIKRKRFGKMLLPNKKFASSLYKKLDPEYFDYLDKWDVKKKIRVYKGKGRKKKEC